MNDENLLKKDDLTPSERRASARRAGIASALKRSAAKRFHEELSKVLDEELTNGMTKGEALVRRLVKDAVSSPKHMKMLLDVLYFYEPKRYEVTGEDGSALRVSIETIDKLYGKLREDKD